MPTLASCARRVALTSLAATLSACTGVAAPTRSVAPPAPPATASVTQVPPSPSDAVVPAGRPWIVYQGGIGGPARIRLVRPDGSGDHVLLQDVPGDNPDGDQQHPDWSHDGSWIAFGAESSDGEQDLWVARPDGSEAHKVFDCVAPCGWSDHPAWSPDDRTIAFVSADHEGDVDSLAYIDTVDVLTGEHRRVAHAPKQAWCYVPRWAPDGHRLVVECDVFKTARFDEEEATSGTIGVVDTTAGAPAFEALLPWNSWATYPDWNPETDTVVFQRPTDLAHPFDAADLAILDVHHPERRTTLTAFGPSGGWAIQPAWTPDGTSITFVAEDVIRSHPNVAVVRADGSSLRRLSDDYFRTHPRLEPTP